MQPFVMIGAIALLLLELSSSSPAPIWWLALVIGMGIEAGFQALATLGYLRGPSRARAWMSAAAITNIAKGVVVPVAQVVAGIVAFGGGIAVQEVVVFALILIGPILGWVVGWSWLLIRVRRGARPEDR